MKNKSFLIAATSKQELRKMLLAAPDAMREGLAYFDTPEKAEKIATACRAETPLGTLIQDAEKLLRDLGIPVPANSDECNDAKRAYIPPPTPLIQNMLREAKPQHLSALMAGRGDGLTSEERQAVLDLMVDLLERHLNVVASPHYWALDAYESLKAAQELMLKWAPLLEAIRQDADKLMIDSSLPNAAEIGKVALEIVDDVTCAVQLAAGAGLGLAKASRLYGNIERAAGGKAKAKNARPNPEREMALEYARMHTGLSSTQIKMRLGLRASERTIRGWLSELC